jgi:hypothetical protein
MRFLLPERCTAQTFTNGYHLFPSAEIGRNRPRSAGFLHGCDVKPVGRLPVITGADAGLDFDTVPSKLTVNLAQPLWRRIIVISLEAIASLP